MMHELQYFRQEIDKVRTRAISRAFSAPPRENAQIVFRADGDPRNVNVDAWATLFCNIETQHGIPLTISGGGYGCFQVSTETLHVDAERLIRAVETRPDLQRLLDDAGASGMEIWKYEGNKSSMEIVAPAATYPCIVVTNRKTTVPLSPGTVTMPDVFLAQEGDELLAGEAQIWVYDPRTRGKRPGPWARLWRRWRGGAAGLAAIDIEHSKITIGALADIIDKAGTTSREATGRARFTVFVHGFKQTITTAVCAVGRVAYNVRYEQIATIPIIYCWPSRNAVMAYFSDDDLADGSELMLTDALQTVCSRKGAPPIVDVLAHSRGAQLTWRAFAALSVGRPAVRNLILVAADLSKPLFSSYLSRVAPNTERVTVYFSAGDIALSLAKIFKTPGTGLQPALPARSGNLDFIDASYLRTDFLGHSYHIGSPEMHSDIRELLDGNPPARRRLLRHDENDPRIWQLQPTAA